MIKTIFHLGCKRRHVSDHGNGESEGRSGARPRFDPYSPSIAVVDPPYLEAFPNPPESVPAFGRLRNRDSGGLRRADAPATSGVLRCRGDYPPGVVGRTSSTSRRKGPCRTPHSGISPIPAGFLLVPNEDPLVSPDGEPAPMVPHGANSCRSVRPDPGE